VTSSKLFQPFTHRGLTFANRIALSPLTRARATSDGVVGELQAEYYRQRASAGLLVTEAIAISPEGRGGAWTPGLYTVEQIEAWRLTTDFVHAAGGLIFAQLWHAGRLSHSSLSSDGSPPVGPAAVAAEGVAFTEKGLVPYEQPRALQTEEIMQLVAQFRRAADNAMHAGFDGIEVHGAHGYLLDSFLRDSINDREDRYGGSIENRARFLVEVIEAVAASAGSNRVAVRISPNTAAGGMRDSDPITTFGYLIDRMNDQDIAWLDMVEGDNLVTRTPTGAIDTDSLAARFTGGVILNHGYLLDMALRALSGARADMIAFGRPFIANPDLVERLRTGAPLAEAPREAWYGGGAKGLIDFPPLENEEVRT
jgi:N-ethylmaleimide reductase